MKILSMLCQTLSLEYLIIIYMQLHLSDTWQIITILAKSTLKMDRLTFSQDLSPKQIQKIGCVFSVLTWYIVRFPEDEDQITSDLILRLRLRNKL